MREVSNDSAGIALAVQSIKDGGVVIFPTDTVYGIGCNPYDKNAIDRIFKIKKRDKTKQLPILGYSKQILKQIVEFDEIANKITDKFWPGRLTLVLPLKDAKLQKLSGSTKTIAVRVPNNKCALTLLKECKLIIGTSANISGKKSLVDPSYLKDKVLDCDVFLNDGPIQSSGASTIIEIKNKNIKILRNGDIHEADLVKTL
jgi:L-threonylcarbamoyladenylate synthase|tara:strand:- start:1419 stop:2021 length:603 start_codon:yes stop_codon:yes gene_type:complete